MTNFVENDTMLMNDPLRSCEKLVARGIGAKNGRSCMWLIQIQINILRLGHNLKAQFCIFCRPESDSHRKILFSLKVILLYTVVKDIKNATKFEKIPYAENKVVASYSCLNISEIRDCKSDYLGHQFCKQTMKTNSKTVKAKCSNAKIQFQL